MGNWKHIIVILLIILFLATIAETGNLLVYKVKSGDNLISIAKRFKININEIIKINKIKNPDLIKIGQKLTIPVREMIYQVKKGDILIRIARSFGVNLEELISINNIKNPDHIYIGQKLIIPVDYDRKRYQLASRYKSINFIWPVQGKLTSNYGYRVHPVYRRREFHSGIDIAVPMGSPVYASESGVVIYSGWSKGYGNLVIIKHRDNKSTYYGHNLELLVKEGERVNQGKIIAFSGNTGISTGPHLHFEIRVNGRTVDPMKYLNKHYLNNGFQV